MRWLLIICFPYLSGFSQPTIEYVNRTYKEYIKTVQIRPNADEMAMFKPSISPLNNQHLRLEFDDLSGEKYNYYAKLINCTAQWSDARLAPLNFLSTFNEFPINAYEFSSTRSIPYIHYTFDIPAVKFPGNYLLVVYQDHSDNIILTHRFMVYDQKATVQLNQDFQGINTLRPTEQPLSFTIRYNDPQIYNPAQNIKVVMRQNHRWDCAVMNNKPTYIRENLRELEFQQIRSPNTFEGGNEFRFVDFRSLNAPGQNTGRLDTGEQPFWLQVLLDKPRRQHAYFQNNDLNGGYSTQNLDFGAGALSGEYIYVTFSLEAPAQEEAIYLMGAFNNWDKTQDNLMKYDLANGIYKTSFLLKQGYYDYLYWSEEDDHYALEGSYFETENEYEILIYHRANQPYTDLLIGYYAFNVNSRQ